MEYFDPPEVFASKISTLVGWMRSAKHAIAFTGAGISTSAGIPDFRSGMDTVLKTGPGVWELQAAKASRPAAAKTVSTLQVTIFALKLHEYGSNVVVSRVQALPTPTHMALVALEAAGVLKHLISQVQLLYSLASFSVMNIVLFRIRMGCIAGARSRLASCPSCTATRTLSPVRSAKRVGTCIFALQCFVCSLVGTPQSTSATFGRALPNQCMSTPPAACACAEEDCKESSINYV